MRLRRLGSSAIGLLIALTGIDAAHAFAITASACTSVASTNITCDGDFNLPPPGPLSASQSETDAISSSSAAVTSDYGFIAGAVSSDVRTEQQPSQSAEAVADGGWIENTFTIVPANPALIGTMGTATASITISAVLSASEDSSDPLLDSAANAFANWQLDLFVAEQQAFAFGSVDSDSPPNGTPTGDTIDIPFEFIFGDPISGPHVSFRAQVRSALSPNGVDVVGASAMLDFSSTVGWLGLSDVQDQGGMPVAITVESDSGFDWSKPHPAVLASIDRDLSGLSDVSSDAVPDVAGLSQQIDDRPRVQLYSGANRKRFGRINFLSGAWSGIAADTIADGDQDGMRDDPAIAVLGRNIATGKLFVQARMADGGNAIAGISFLSAAWEPVDIVIIDDGNGDGVSNDTAIGVIGINPNRSFRQRNLMQVRRLSDGSVLNNIYFANGSWTPLAAGAVPRPGKSPLLGVLIEKANSKDILVQARVLDTGDLQRNTSFLTTSWRARDLGIAHDTNGDGIANDASYVVLAVNPGNGKNVLQIRRPGGTFVKNIFVLNENWMARRVGAIGDISGNLFEELGVLGNRNDNGEALIQLKDFDTTDTTGGISP